MLPDGPWSAYVGLVDNRAAVRDFLTTRRARLTPDQVGLPSTGSRRVPGLRRSEVATLAGLSVEYYARLERGQIAGGRPASLERPGPCAAARRHRARPPVRPRSCCGRNPTSGRPRRVGGTVAVSRPSLQWALTSITDGVAFVRDPRQNLLATNDLGRAFYTPVIGDAGRQPNLARFQFLDPASRDFYPDWDLFAEMCVANMRAEAGRDPHDRALQDLVGELSTHSETFRRLWAAHDVRTHGAGTKRFHHPVVGELSLAYEELLITAEPGLALYIYSAEPGSPSAERLQLLASWGATADASAPTPLPGQDR